MQKPVFISILVGVACGLIACSPRPTPDIKLNTPQPTNTRPVAVPTPTTISLNPVQVVMVATTTPALQSGPGQPVATRAPSAQAQQAATAAPTQTRASGATPTQPVGTRGANATVVPTGTPRQVSGAVQTTPTATPTRTPASATTPSPTPRISPTTTATPSPTSSGEPTKTSTPTPAPTSTQASQPTSTSVAQTPPPPMAGVELDQLTTAGGLDLAKNLGAHWVRRNGLVWSAVEATEGERNWGAVAGLEQELRDASAKNMEVVLIVRSAPAWAQKVPGVKCGRLLPEKLAAFGAFLRDAVARYSVAPYNVKHWEIWNEPDTPQMDSESVFGCMGDPGDTYFGGGEYGELLKAVYPQIKSANPQAQVLFGGLLLDCDPAHPPSGRDCKESKFLEGALRVGAGNSFDGVSFHGYDYVKLTSPLGQYDNANWASSSLGTAANVGPVSIAKARFLRGVLGNYAAGDKYLMNTETAAIVYQGTDTNDNIDYTKAVYAIESMAAALAEGLRANIWYSLKGWNLSGLVKGDGQPNVAYNSLKFIVEKLRDVVYTGPVNQYPGVTGYEFNSAGKRLWVIWSVGGTERSIALPKTPRKVYDEFGNETSASQTITLKTGPATIELD